MRSRVPTNRCRPALVVMFSFVGRRRVGDLGRGLAAVPWRARDQEEHRAVSRSAVEQVAAFPAFIGTSWFQWGDQPCTSRADGENYNIGLVGVTDRPYTERVESLRATRRRMQGVAAGIAAPCASRPRPQQGERQAGNRSGSDGRSSE